MKKIEYRFGEKLREVREKKGFRITSYNVCYTKLLRNRLGAIGFLSYEALHTIENIKKGTINNYTLPLLNWTP